MDDDLSVSHPQVRYRQHRYAVEKVHRGAGNLPVHLERHLPRGHRPGIVRGDDARRQHRLLPDRRWLRLAPGSDTDFGRGHLHRHLVGLRGPHLIVTGVDGRDHDLADLQVRHVQLGYAARSGLLQHDHLRLREIARRLRCDTSCAQGDVPREELHFPVHWRRTGLNHAHLRRHPHHLSEPGVRRVDVERDGCLRTLHRVQVLGAARWAQVVVTQVLRPDLASAYGDFGRRQDRRVLLYLSGFTNGLVIDVELDMAVWFGLGRDRKSTRLNSSHVAISYAVFCLKKNTSLDKTLHQLFP